MVDLTPTQAKLGSLKLGYAGQVVAHGLSLVGSISVLLGHEKNTRDFFQSFVSWTVSCWVIIRTPSGV